MKITGTTTIFGVIGNPVRHTFSPIMQNAAFEAMGLNCAYIPMEVPPDLLHNAMRGIVALDIKGVNVTIPHKENVIPYLDVLSPDATTLGSVNTILINDKKKLEGFNTDGEGFIYSLQNDLQFSCEGKTILILGTGGACRAVAHYCAKFNAYHIMIAGRTITKVEHVLARINQFYPNIKTTGIEITYESLTNALQSSDLLVNSTPIGMKHDDPVPVPFESLHSNLSVYDLVYNPLETKLVQAAKMQGCKAVNGLGMLIHQGALSFKIWLGISPPTDVMKNAILEHLNFQHKMSGD